MTFYELLKMTSLIVCAHCGLLWK